jgi:tetratricopeptide (TPR) repeat protein
MKGRSQFVLGQYENAINNLKTAARLRPTSFWPHIFSAAALVGLGRMDEAGAAIREALSRKSDCSVAFISQINKNIRSGYLEKLLDHLQKAGLPE